MTTDRDRLLVELGLPRETSPEELRLELAQRIVATEVGDVSRLLEAFKLEDLAVELGAFMRASPKFEEVRTGVFREVTPPQPDPADFELTPG